MKKKFCVITVIIFISFVPIISAEIQFEEVTQIAGISYSGTSWGSYWGNLNGDQWPDIWTANHGNNSNLFLNNGDGTFTDVSKKVVNYTLSGKDPHGSSWADFDNDGDQDLIILTGAQRGEGEGPKILLINNNGLLSDQAADFGLEYSLGRGRTPLWFDYDRDGLLDLIMSTFPRPDGKAPTALFHQTSSGFEDVTLQSGIKFKNKVGSTASQVSDLSGDGKMELIFMTPVTEGIYDFSKFPAKNIQTELKFPDLWSSDFTIADFNGDLMMDVFLSRMVQGTDIEDSARFLDDKLFIKTGKGFEDITLFSNFHNPTNCRSVVAGDFDNDMDIDIYSVCTGHKKNLPNVLYENTGEGTFNLISNSGAEGSVLGVGDTVSLADYNNDGFLDLFVTNGMGPHGSQADEGPSQLFKNMGNDNHWLEIDLKGKVSNLDGIGTIVLLSTGDTSQIREQNGGMHYRSQNFQRLHFGLGENMIIDSLIVFWPSGIVHELTNVEVDSILEIVEPTTPIPPRHQISLGVNPSEVLCKHGLNLIFKPSFENVACVKPSTISSLSERGWKENF